MTLARTVSAQTTTRQTRDEWVDRNAGRMMVLPAVVILLAFAIFPLIISVYLSLSRFALEAGGFRLKFVGFYNFRRLLFGAQQYHFLGTLKPLNWPEWIGLGAFTILMLLWLGRYVATGFTALGFIGRLISAGLATG